MPPPDFIPYARQHITEEDIQAVVDVLRSDWLTTGPMVERFEQAVCDYTGARHGVAVCNGTAALHCAMHAIGIGPGDEVILPPMTFVATANAVLYQGGTPVFADVEEDTLLVDPNEVERLITPRTRAIIAVDYAGQPCDYDALRDIADRHGLWLVADACHSLGGSYKGRKVGTLADLTCFSFHPVKPITTGEGGMVMTDRPELAEKMRRFRNHGIDRDHRARQMSGGWDYDVTGPGMNYRLTDIQCALGVSQLSRLETILVRRQRIAEVYDQEFATCDCIRPLALRHGTRHAHHLYVVKLRNRDRCFHQLMSLGIGVNVHYKPVPIHSWYRERQEKNYCPCAEANFEKLLSLPFHADLRPVDVFQVAKELITIAASS